MYILGSSGLSFKHDVAYCGILEPHKVFPNVNAVLLKVSVSIFGIPCFFMRVNGPVKEVDDLVLK